MGERCRQTLLVFLHFRGDGGLLVVEPVYDEGLIIQGHGGTERDVCHRVYGGRDEETQAALLVVSQRVAPQSTYVVCAVRQQHIRNAPSERKKGKYSVTACKLAGS